MQLTSLTGTGCQTSFIFIHNLLGTNDPLEADNWLKHIEKNYGTLNCSDEEKVRFVAFKLKDRAYEWWTLEKVVLTRGPGGAPWIWRMF